MHMFNLVWIKYFLWILCNYCGRKVNDTPNIREKKPVGGKFNLFSRLKHFSWKICLLFFFSKLTLKPYPFHCALHFHDNVNVIYDVKITDIKLWIISLKMLKVKLFQNSPYQICTSIFHLPVRCKPSIHIHNMSLYQHQPLPLLTKNNNSIIPRWQKTHTCSHCKEKLLIHVLTKKINIH